MISIYIVNMIYVINIFTSSVEYILYNKGSTKKYYG